MKGKVKFCSGDYFSIPMKDGRFAIAQVLWLGTDSKDRKFRKIFAFAVRSIGNDLKVFEEKRYLSFRDYKGEFVVIFTSLENLVSGEWPRLQEGAVSDEAYHALEFNMAGTLYRKGFPLRPLEIDEYKDHLLMGVSGYALVESYLQQHTTTG
ncbi:hypothetical protein ACLUUI_20080 [Enterobacterales bacterium AW_CKDN230030176-1A_HGKHYDSX7]|uniref:hypothetical protein n=1 Tax=Pseudomonas entomophila TaxID=312306 RepID=UPI0015E2B77C|nr:hypothetical protein [Pseudomonas entomophila]MBA1192477.1 hypothetical protein [Pseudomonas entomophila]